MIGPGSARSGWTAISLLALVMGGADARASEDIEVLQQDFAAGRYEAVWSRAEGAQRADVLVLGADAATSQAFCRGFDEASRPVLDKAIELAEQAIERAPDVADAWLQFARAKGAWLRRYAFTPDLLETCAKGLSSFSYLLKAPRLLALKRQAGSVTNAFQQALRLEPNNGVALAGLAATELMEPLHPCVDSYTEEKAQAALQRMAQGLRADGPEQLKSFIAADALQTAKDDHGLQGALFARHGLSLEALWQGAAEVCPDDAYCACMADRANAQLEAGGAQ